MKYLIILMSVELHKSLVVSSLFKLMRIVLVKVNVQFSILHMNVVMDLLTYIMSSLLSLIDESPQIGGHGISV